MINSAMVNAQILPEKHPHFCVFLPDSGRFPAFKTTVNYNRTSPFNGIHSAIPARPASLAEISIINQQHTT
jgi:hypothetical protein